MRRGGLRGISGDTYVAEIGEASVMNGACLRAGVYALEFGNLTEVDVAVFVQVGALAGSDRAAGGAEEAVHEPVMVREVHAIVTGQITGAARRRNLA
ncbi:MAG: hypothetical protein PVI86_12660, partial [Phycisphaerae bacterium]